MPQSNMVTKSIVDDSQISFLMPKSQLTGGQKHLSSDETHAIISHPNLDFLAATATEYPHLPNFLLLKK